jgi:ssRNA-specific RNase YbeY (16S rRNA maturation enzyme)
MREGHLFEEDLCRFHPWAFSLLGYDHEIPGPRARTMRKKENELFSLVKAKVS